jgi:hypothetical protein
MQPDLIWIPLTDEQAKLLERHFAHTKGEAERGRRGMLVAQVWERRVECGDAPGMCVGFIPAELAQQLAGKAA